MMICQLNQLLVKKALIFLVKLVFNPSKHLNFEYDFSIDNNFDKTNYSLLKAGLNINNFITTFDFLKKIILLEIKVQFQTKQNII